MQYFCKKTNDMHNIEKCQDYAISLRNRGYNCAQCVLMSLSKHIGLDEDLAARISAAYGTGFGGTGKMCGVMSILGVAEGMMTPGSEPQDKSAAMWRVKELLEKFTEENQDRYLCCELKGKEDARKCPDLIKQSIRLFLEEHPEPAAPRGLMAKIRRALNS